MAITTPRCTPERCGVPSLGVGIKSKGLRRLYNLMEIVFGSIFLQLVTTLRLLFQPPLTTSASACGWRCSLPWSGCSFLGALAGPRIASSA